MLFPNNHLGELLCNKGEEVQHWLHRLCLLLVNTGKHSRIPEGKNQKWSFSPSIWLVKR